jgi:hypothetical protein
MGSHEVGPTELGSAQRCAHETGPTEVGFTEIGFPEICLPEIGSTEMGLLEIDPTEFGPKEIHLKTRVLSSPLIPNMDSLLQNLYLSLIGHRLILSRPVSPPALPRPAYLSP